MDKYITGKVTAKGAKEGCLCPIRVDGSPFRVQVPSGSWSGRMLRLSDIRTRTGVHTVYVTLKVVPEKKRARWWKVLLWILVFCCVVRVAYHLIYEQETPTTVQKTTAAVQTNATPVENDLSRAMDRLYKAGMGEGTAGEVEIAIIQRTRWNALTPGGPRGTMVEIIAPDMEKMMQDMERELADGTLQARTPDDVLREMVKRLMTSQYEERKTSLVVQTVYDEAGDPQVVETEELADALYGGLLSWQKQAAEKMGVRE